MSAANETSPDSFFQRKRNSSRKYQMLYPAELMVYRFVCASKLALPGTSEEPTSAWPSKMPIGVLMTWWRG